MCIRDSLTTQLNLYQNQILQAKKNTLYAEETDENFEKIKEAFWSVFATLNKITANELLDLFLGCLLYTSRCV